MYNDLRVETSRSEATAPKHHRPHTLAYSLVRVGATYKIRLSLQVLTHSIRTSASPASSFVRVVGLIGVVVLVDFHVRLGVLESLHLSVWALVEVAPLVLPVGGLLAEQPHLSSLILLFNCSLVANSLRVFPVLLLPSENPHHAVLEAPLLSSFHMPLAESVDICSMVDIFVHEILLGFDFVSGLEVDLLRVHARIETGAGVLAVEH